ncbi:MAG TPA: zinc metalloprotease HtpX [Nitrospirota bacterium]|nr:zinc metalloprotease HtpX [Nitrospirota bacterium]
MPFTFIDIERQKNWRIGIFFFLLLALYFVICALITAPFLHISGAMGVRYWVAAGILALVAAGIHFWFSAYDAVGVVIRTLGAQPPDPQDDVHKMLLNVMEEIHIASGRERALRCFVAPTLSLNALAVADLKGEAAIGITEGLLSRLTRPQLETVIAHEAHHVLSGDCLETTVAASLFGTSSSAIEKLNSVSAGRVYLFPGIVLAWLLLQLSYCVNMFVSREREYRADAAAVRMTRNPTALAEALFLLSRSWRGAGFIGSGLEMLCIVNPRLSELDETEGFLADLLSTHPPLGKRIDVLLAMAHTSLAGLHSRRDRGNGGESAAAPGTRYFAQDPRQAWQGPFTFDELAAQPWLSPLTWISPEGGGPAARAWKTAGLAALFTVSAMQKDHHPSDVACPVCNQPLIPAAREGASVLQCRFCSGMLVDNSRIQRILARTGRDHPCSERMNALARTMLARNQQAQMLRKLVHESTPQTQLLSCPKCSNAMVRGFYSQAYLIEIDRCSLCGLTWFDQNELDLLQCLIAAKTGRADADAP